MRQKLFPVLVLLLALFLGNSCSQSDHPAWTTPELNTSDMVLQVGQTAVRTGISKIPKIALEYSSSNPSVATVDQSGLVTALNVGETTITVNMPYPMHPNYITSASFLVKVVAIPANQLKDIDKATPLTLVADEDGSIIVTFNGGIALANDIHYSINGGAEQTIPKNTKGEVKIAVVAGDVIQFWSTNTALSSGPGSGGAASRALTRAVDEGAKYINIRPSMKTEIYGNVMSLLKGKDGLEGATALEAKNAFYGLFAGAEKLVNNDERQIVLPATRLTEGCYQNMFNGCKGIEKAPELPAPKLEKNCYQEMFYDCAKLNSVKCLATDISAENCTKDWLGKAGTEATGTKTLETLVPMTPNSDDGVPTSWTPQKLVESVTLGKTELALVIGEADVTLTATVKPDDATDKTVTWTSSNPAVATVTATTDNTKGTVHAVAAGTATITATAGDKSATCKVTVKEASTATDLSTLTADYEAKDGETLTGTLNGSTQPYKISIADGATVTLDNVAINGVSGGSATMFAGITCNGNATIILKDGTTNTVKGFTSGHPGIFVPSEMTLTIKGETAGTGKLTASSNGNGAGIGGGYSINCGNIEIQGGVITATGSSYAAGIGGANSSTCGSITISGGTVTATGGDKGAGIGSGGGTCGNITISGGTVTANGGNEGAGIGSGGGGTCGDILISGGTVLATGGTDAAGIGSGTGTEGCGAITISGGTVTATGGENAAGIGSGYEGTCTTITISGGTVTATGGNGNGGAGIGSGNGGSCGNIMITSGVTSVTATKGAGADNSIGIASSRSGSCGTVTIGCTLNSDGNPVGGTTGAISTSPYTYPAPTVGGVNGLPSFDGGGDLFN